MNPVWFFFLNIDIPFLRIDTVSPNKILRYSRVSIFSYTPSAGYNLAGAGLKKQSHAELYSGPLTPSSLSLWTVALWPALQITEHKNSQTQEQFFSPRPYPTWTAHNTPRYCTSVNNSNIHLYIGHMHIHSSVYGHFSFLYIFIFYYYCYS